MDEQKLINQNLTNSISIINKSLMNLLERQMQVFQATKHTNFASLTALDLSALNTLQNSLERMKEYVK